MALSRIPPPVAGPHRIYGYLCRWNGININIALELNGGNISICAKRPNSSGEATALWHLCGIGGVFSLDAVP